MAGLEEVKSTLKSLVVSSPTQVDVRSLLRDYRAFMGKALPFEKYGYSDAVLFLRERCKDCFLFQGNWANPTLILIVNDKLKHIDEHVRRQRTPSTKRLHSNYVKPKRASVQDTFVKPKESVIAQSYKDRIAKQIGDNQRSDSPTQPAPKQDSAADSHSQFSGGHTSHKSISDLVHNDKENVANQEDGNYSRPNLQNFLRKRLPLYNSWQHLDAAPVETDCKDGASLHTSDSGRQTASSGSSARRGLLEELKDEVTQIVEEHPDGVLCTDVVHLYRERFGRELELTRCGLTSVMALLEAAPRLKLARSPGGEWRARVTDTTPPPQAGRTRAGAAPHPHPHPHPRPLSAHASPRSPVDVDDALPGVDFDPDVFPADCMHFMESVPTLGAGAFLPGEMAGVAVGEVYSPSHFWLIRLGDQFNLAMEEMMDRMNEYYTDGAGKSRVLAVGAVRPGHYCASVYDGDWHRSIIVRELDCDTVKVRHVDYGTVDRVSCEALRPLLRRWAALPAQAVRARLAGVRPGAGGRRWPPAAAAAFLRLVRDKHLVASVLATDTEEDVVEVVLVDTTTEADVVIADELVRLGHADPRPDSALGTSECYLFPRFEVLESGATPNFAEIHAYLRDGIALECVEEYRRHVPAALPPLQPAASAPSAPFAPSAATADYALPAPPPPAELPLLTRVPLMRGPSAHSDKAIQISPPPSPSPPPPVVSLIDFSPPHSPPAHATPSGSAASLAHAFSTMNISLVPTIAASTPAFFAPSTIASDPSTTVSVPSTTVSVVSPAAPAPSTAVASSSANRAPSPAAAALSLGSPLVYSAAGSYSTAPSPAVAASCPRPTQSYRAEYRAPPPRFLPPMHAPCPLVYPRMMPPPPPQPPYFYGPYPYPPGGFPPTQSFTPHAHAHAHMHAHAHAPPKPPGPPGRLPPTPYGAEPAGPGGDTRCFRTPDGGSVTLSISECEIFRLLSRVDPHAAHWYMVDALSRAMGTRIVSAGPAPEPRAPAALNPEAREFRQLRGGQCVRPPPGFEDRC